MKVLSFLLSLLFLFFSFSYVKAQSDERVGTFSLTSYSGSDPNWTVAGVYSSGTGFSATDVQVGDMIVVRYVLGVTHSRNIYKITAINSAGGSNLNVDVTRVEGTSTTYFPAGTHAVTNTLNNKLYDVPNVSQQLESYIDNYNIKSLDSADVWKSVTTGDSIYIVTYGLDTILTGGTGGSGGANLSTSTSSTTVTVASDSGTDAVLPAATTSSAGVLTAADKSVIDNTITSFSGDVTGVISTNNANLQLIANSITSTDLASSSVSTAKIVNNAVDLTKIGDAPSNTILGNSFSTTSDPSWQTAGAVQAMISVDDLITLSGLAGGTQNLGTFTGSTISDNNTIKPALQELETAVENTVSTTLSSGKLLVGSATNQATSQTPSGDLTMSNTGVFTVDKQNDIQFVDENSALGAKGTVATIKYFGAGVTATRSADTVTVNIPGGSGGGLDTLTSADSTIVVTEITSTHKDVVVDLGVVKPMIDTCYAVTITSGNAGSVLWVCANGTGVTASFSSGVLTVASTSNVAVKSIYWTLVSADVQSGADAGGVSQWVQVKFTNMKANTGLTDLRIPVIQRTAIPSSGALSVSNAATIDHDNSPSESVVGVSSNSLTLRIGGLSAVGAQGYMISITGIH